MPEHLERRHALDTHAYADIRKLDSLRRGGRDFVGDEGVAVSERMGYQVIVRHLEKRTYGRRLIALTCRPFAD
jgi:hypothetical protein